LRFRREETTVGRLQVAKMKTGFFKHFTSDWKPTLTLWLPIFLFLMWYAMSLHLQDLWLLAVVLALGSWEISSRAVLLVRQWKEWRRSKELEKPPWERREV